MKLASLDNGRPDGRLLVVSHDLSRYAEADAAATMQEALDRWDEIEPALRGQTEALERSGGRALDLDHLLAAMPRSYQFLDGSAFLAHNHILADAWGYERRTPDDPPLMYQGLSDHFLPPHGSVPFRSEVDDIDLEAEYGVITDRVPRGTAPDSALAHIKLLVLINDWSLRAFGPAEMKAGFGFLHAKPPSTLSAIAVTPDELGGSWADGRIRLPLAITVNGALLGRPDGAEMTYNFGRLLAHAATTRDLCAGSVIGSGTVSSADAHSIGSGCLAERRALDQIAGREPTPYLREGDEVTIECTSSAGQSLFGPICQKVAIVRSWCGI